MPNPNRSYNCLSLRKTYAGQVYWYHGEGDNFVKNDDHFSNFVLKHVIGYDEERSSYARRIREQARKNPQIARRLEDLGERLGFYEKER